MWLWKADWEPAARTFLRADSLRDALEKAKKRKPTPGSRLLLVERWYGPVPASDPVHTPPPYSTPPKEFREPDALYEITVLDVQGNVVERIETYCPTSSAAYGQAAFYVVQQNGYIVHSEWIDGRHLAMTMNTGIPMRRNPAGSCGCGTRARRSNPAGYLVELRDMSGNRMGGARISARSAEDARRIAKLNFAKRGLRLVFEVAEFRDRSGDVIVPATVLPTRSANPVYARNCYQWW